MTTLTLDPVQIEKVVSSPSDAGGCYRDVWFFGDIVIKKDDCGGDVNEGEYLFYCQFIPSSFEFEGETWTVELPKTAMIDEYIIMEKVKYPHIELSDGKKGCDFCTMEKETHSYIDFAGNKTIRTYKRHSDNCSGANFIVALDNHMSWEHEISDTHAGNFMVDIENNRVIFVDFAQ